MPRVCLLPVGIFNLLCSFQIFVSFSLGGMPVNLQGVAKCMTTVNKHLTFFDILTFLLFMQFTTMDIEEPLFQPFPSDIVFQNFNPFETYQVPLQLRNNDKVNTVVFVCDWFVPSTF